MHPSSRFTRHPAAFAELLRLGTEEHYEDAKLYDLEYAERSADIEWYRAIADEELGPPGDHVKQDDHVDHVKQVDQVKQVDHCILELGAGTGRISLPLAHDSRRVLALDRKASMLEHLRQKFESQKPAGSIEILPGDILDIPLPDNSVPLVIAPFNVLMHLYSWQQLLACFREVARVLSPGGLFALDVLLPDLEWLTWDPETRHAVTPFKDPQRGEWLLYSTNHSYDPATQVCHVRIYYDRPATPKSRTLRGSTPVHMVHLAHRQIFPEELRILVAQAGFDLLSHEGDFGDCSLQEGVESQCLRCRLPLG